MIQQKKVIAFLGMVTLFLPAQAALQRAVQTARTNPGLAAAGAATLGLLFQHQSIDQVRTRVDHLEKEVRGTEGDGKTKPFSLSKQVTLINGILHGDDQKMVTGLVSDVEVLNTTVGKRPAPCRKTAWQVLEELEKRPVCACTASAHSMTATSHSCGYDEKNAVSRKDLEALSIGKPSTAGGSTLWQRMEALDTVKQLAKTTPELPTAAHAPVHSCGYDSAAFEGLQRKVRTIETTLGEPTQSDGRSIWDHVGTLNRAAQKSGSAHADGQHESKQMVTQKEFSERFGPVEDALAGLQQRVTTDAISDLVARSMEQSALKAQATSQQADLERTRQTRELVAQTVNDQFTAAAKRDWATKDELKGYIKATTLPALVKKTELNLLMQKANAFQELLQRVAHLEAAQTHAAGAAEKKATNGFHAASKMAEEPTEAVAADALTALASGAASPLSVAGAGQTNGKHEDSDKA